MNPILKWGPDCEGQPGGRRLSVPSQDLCGVSDAGCYREQNEDAYGFSPDRRLWVVADGMGGHAAGEVASCMTVRAILQSMEAALSPQADDAAGMIPDHLLNAFADAHSIVLGHSLDHLHCRGMGSTGIAGIVDGDILHLCHVGDSRAYHISEGRFRRVTNDHSWVWQNLVMPGILTADQGRCHPMRSNLLQAIGNAHIYPELTSLALKPGDRILLCTDGLWEGLRHEQIGQIVTARGPVETLGLALVEKAIEAGGRDNITLILYEHAAESHT
ncbi:MAG TPA: protein phosphatase 2C domain-containing protein [Bryobacteraceae bacterium]|nr:protein phosphatase 2C domain-containing protein [Bryobacteraceae bacterium]